MSEGAKGQLGDLGFGFEAASESETARRLIQLFHQEAMRNTDPAGRICFCNPDGSGIREILTFDAREVIKAASARRSNGANTTVANEISVGPSA
jgi:hypothetical protein